MTDSQGMGSSHRHPVKWALEQARRDLVDLSRRNRLLHAPLTGKRPWCLAILGHEVDDVFDAIHRRDNFRGYAFQGQDEEVTADGGEIGSDEFGEAQQSRPFIVEANDSAAPRREGRPRLQTRLTTDKLEKRLTKIFREDRTLEEEQGLSTLCLALGFLKWTEDDRSEEVSLAPL